MAACGSSPANGNPTPGHTPVASTGSGVTPTATATPPAVTQPVPATSTDCPAAGTARAAVTANLVLGHHNTLVYVVNEFQSSGGTARAGTLKRFDVSANTKTEIINLPNVTLDHVQISGDGKWAMFTTYTNPQYKLQLVRLDGQGLQTLTCTSGVSLDSPQWSADMRHVIFSVRQDIGQETVYLLTLNTGDLQPMLTVPDNGAGQGVQIGAWLDNSHVYLTNVAIDQPHDTLYILDITRGANQNLSSLPALVHRTFGDFDSSYNSTQLFVDYGYCGIGGCSAPGNITAQSAHGGAETTVLNEAHYVITTVRAVSADTLLLLINTSQPGGGVDTSHNGLWKIHTNGSGLTRLSTDPANQGSTLNYWSQFPWSNVSRDSGLYALRTSTSPTVALSYGSLNSGSPTTFSSESDGTDLGIAGWTTM